MATVVFVKVGKILPDYPLVTPPIGIMQLAAIVRQDTDHDVHIVDMRAAHMDAQDLVRMLKPLDPDIIGFSCLTAERNELFKVVEMCQEKFPHRKLIAGGPYPTSYPEELLQRTAIDVLAMGESDLVIVPLVNALLENGNLQDVKGIAYKNINGIHKQERAPYVQDYDALPRVAYDLINPDHYEKNYSMTPLGLRRYMGIMTSRGCPYNCIYCHNIFGKKFRPRSPGKVVDEMVYLGEKYQIFEFEIIDDIFNFDKKHAKEICDLIVERNLNVRLTFPNAVRGDLLDKELLEKMYKAGTYFISFAPESGSPEIQKNIRKNANLQKLNEMINYAVELGIFTNGFFMMGFPEETEKQMKETISFASKSKLHTASFFTVTPFRGTPLWQSVNGEEGKEFEGGKSFATNMKNVSAVPDKRFYSLKRKANIKFYFLGFRSLRILWSYPHKNVFLFMMRLIIVRMFKGLFSRKPA